MMFRKLFVLLTVLVLALSSVTIAMAEETRISWVQWQTEYTDQINELLGYYMEENPGVVIDLDMAGELQKTKALIAANATPDALMTNGGSSLEDMLAFVEDISDEPFFQSIRDDLKFSVEFDGRGYGIPVTYASYGLIYNKAILADVGMTEPPKTLDELGQLCEKIKAKGITPIGNLFNWTWLFTHFLNVSSFANMPNWQDVIQQLNNGEITFKDLPEFEDTLNMIDFLCQNSVEGSPIVDVDEMFNSFAQGEVAMIFCGSWSTSKFLGLNPALDIDMMPLPTTNDPADWAMSIGPNCCWSIGKTANSSEVRKIFNWIFTSEKAKSVLLDEMKTVPPFVGWEYRAEGDPLMQACANYVESGPTSPWTFLFWPTAFMGGNGAIFQKYILGEYDRATTLDELTRLWQETGE